MTEKTLPIKYENKINRRGYNPYVLEYKYSDENTGLRKEKIILEDKCMNIEVKTNDWILPNRVGYNKYIYNTFHPSKYSKKKTEASCDCTKDSCELDVSKVSLFPQQRIIKDYMQIDSPYRGILLYHELGSGKSAASIAAANIGLVYSSVVFK